MSSVGARRGLGSTKAVADAIYLLAGGKGKSRMHKDITMREQSTWRTFILSTGGLPW